MTLLSMVHPGHGPSFIGHDFAFSLFIYPDPVLGYCSEQYPNGISVENSRGIAQSNTPTGYCSEQYPNDFLFYFRVHPP